MSETNTTRIPEWDQFSHLLSRKEVPAKTTLLREGQISTTAFYIEKGCIRSWFNQDGRDITFQFFFEREAVSSVESFMTGQPSLFNIESIEPCSIQTISKKDFLFILDNSPAFKKDVEENIFKRLIFYQQLFLSRIKDKPQKRYEELLKQRPEILQRIPLHYIASYLGITPVSLSRIRNRY